VIRRQSLTNGQLLMFDLTRACARSAASVRELGDVH